MMDVKDILQRIVETRQRQLERGLAAGDATSPEDLDDLRLAVLQAELELARELEKEKKGHARSDTSAGAG
jgi:hypothetical protein